MPAAASEAVASPIPSPAADSDPAKTVLVAEDDALYRRALQHILGRNGYTVRLVGDGSEAWRQAQMPHPPRLLILDWMMPGLSGPEVCRRLRECAPQTYQYLLLLTAKHTTADIVEGLEAGADDYLTKPFNVHELLARVRVGERLVKLHDRLLAAQEALRFQATHDPLTGWWNRGALFELLTAEMERALRKATSLSLFMIDLDRFKHVNDEFGHLAGDAVLREVAQRLAAAVRPYDVIGRYGGEEFLVAAAELEADHPRQFGERLRLAVSSSPIAAASVQVSITVSIGVVTVPPRLELSVEKMIQAADAALYRAKGEGRDRVETVQL